MQTIRIDKYLAQLNLVSRREAKKFFRAWRLQINGYVELDHGFEVIDGDTIVIDGGSNPLESSLSGGGISFVVKQVVTVLINKPAGYVCSEIDEWWHLSYKKLLEDCIYAPFLKVAGRLDQDTTGLVVATSDGDLNHRLTSPKSGKEKEYIVTCKNEVSDKDIAELEKGVRIDDDYLTLPCTVVRKSPCIFHLIIREGKYHQVKQMCAAIGNECVALQRIRMGEWTIEGIEEGKRRQL